MCVCVRLHEKEVAELAVAGRMVLGKYPGQVVESVSVCEGPLPLLVI